MGDAARGPAETDRLRALKGPCDLACVECGATWANDSELWRALLTDDGEVAVYCADCAEREFGNAGGIWRAG